MNLHKPTKNVKQTLQTLSFFGILQEDNAPYLKFVIPIHLRFRFKV